MVGDDRPARRVGHAYLDRRRRVPVRRDGPGLRPARPPVARRHARRRRRARGVRRRAEAPPGRLRAVEAGQAGRAVVAVAVGRRPAGLAQRVRRDEPRPARRGLRPALRRHGPALPAPRERAGPGGGARRALRHPLDAPRLRRRRRGREDVQEPRQRDNLLDLLDHYDERTYRMLLLQSHYRSPVRVGVGQPAGGRAIARRTRRVRRPQRRRRPASRTPPCSTRSAPRWTTTSTRRRRWPCCSTPSGGPTPPSMPAASEAGSLVAAVFEIAGAVGLELGRADDVPAEVVRAGRRPRRRPGREGLRRRRRHPRRAPGRPAGSSRRRPTGTAVRR